MKPSRLDEHLASCAQCRKGPVLCTTGRALVALSTSTRPARQHPAELDDDLTWLT